MQEPHTSIRRQTIRPRTAVAVRVEYLLLFLVAVFCWIPGSLRCKEWSARLQAVKPLAPCAVRAPRPPGFNSSICVTPTFPSRRPLVPFALRRRLPPMQITHTHEYHYHATYTSGFLSTVRVSNVVRTLRSVNLDAPSVTPFPPEFYSVAHLTADFARLSLQ